MNTLSTLELVFPLSAACVVERPVYGRKFTDCIPPHPIVSQNSFHPFSSFTSTSCNSLILPIPLSPSSSILSTSSSSISSVSSLLLPALNIVQLFSQVAVALSSLVIFVLILLQQTASFHGIRPLGPMNELNLFGLFQSLSSIWLLWLLEVGALAPNTRSTYATGLLCFTQFCDKWSISEEDHMPASHSLLCAFIGEYKGLHSGSTIKLWLSGLRCWHIVNHAPWYGNNKWVHLACISANEEGIRHKRLP